MTVSDTPTGDSEKPSQQLGSSHGLNLVLAASGAVPFVGGPLQYLLDSYLPQSMDSRWRSFVADLESRIADLEEADVSEPRFVDAFLRSSRIALGTHLDGKIRILAAAVQGIAYEPDRFSDELVERFFVMIERFSPRHIEAMRLMRDTKKPKRGHYEEYENYVVELLESAHVAEVDPMTRLAIARDLDEFDLIQYVPAGEPRLLSDEGVLFLDFLRHLDDDEGPET